MYIQMQDNQIKNKRVIGIDPGYGRCGFAVIEEQGRDWKCIRHGVFTTSQEKYHEDRLAELGLDFQSVVRQYKPDLLVIEELFFSKNQTTALKVSEVRGVILFLARKEGLDIVQVKPNEVKLAVTGYGRADKKQIQEMVKTIFGFKDIPKPDDAADALAIAWTGCKKKIF